MLLLQLFQFMLSGKWRKLCHPLSKTTLSLLVVAFLWNVHIPSILVDKSVIYLFCLLPIFSYEIYDSSFFNLFKLIFVLHCLSDLLFYHWWNQNDTTLHITVILSDSISILIWSSIISSRHDYYQASQYYFY